MRIRYGAQNIDKNYNDDTTAYNSKNAFVKYL